MVSEKNVCSTLKKKECIRGNPTPLNNLKKATKFQYYNFEIKNIIFYDDHGVYRSEDCMK